MDELQFDDGRIQAIGRAAMLVKQHETAGKSPADADAYQAHVDLGNTADDIVKVLAERQCLMEVLKDVLAAASSMHMHCKPTMNPAEHNHKLQVIQDAEKCVLSMESECLPGSGHRHYLVHVVGDIEPELHGPYLTDGMRDGIAGVLRLDDSDDGLYKMDVYADGRILIDAYSGGEMEELAEEALVKVHR